MSTYTSRRVRKRVDYFGIFMFLIVLVALPAAGYIGYLFVNDPGKLAELGLTQVDAKTGQAPVAVATTAPASTTAPSSTVAPAATSGSPATPAKSTAAVAKAGAGSLAAAKMEPSKTEVAVVTPPAMTKKPTEVGPPVKGPGKPTTVAQAVEHIGANIHDALSLPRKVLVVWLVDESNSCADYRQELNTAMDKMYKGLKQTKPEADKELDDQPLLSVVAGFAKDVRFATPEPTADASEVTRAVSEIVDAPSGEENTIKAVNESLTKFLPFRVQKGRHLMFVVVSDEVGDDQKDIDLILPKLKQYTIPVYTVGVVAPFGSDGKTMKLTPQGGGVIGIPDPSSAKGDFKVVFGPESREVEWVKIRYPDGGGDSDLGDLDMGPYTLTRLCVETGGEYFPLRTRRADPTWGQSAPAVAVAASGGGGGNNRDAGEAYFRAIMGGGGGNAPLPQMEATVITAPVATVPGMTPAVNYKKYAPAYVSEKDYQDSKKNKAKEALIEASKMTPVEVLPSSVNTMFGSAGEDVRRTQAIINAQKPAALVEEGIRIMYETLKKGEADSAKLTEPRLKAGFDLAYGRIMAAKARSDGYMSMLAALRNGKAASGISPSDDKIKNSVVDKLADNARERLKRVVDEHPNTPWARAAERELRAPMGWKFIEN